MLNFVTSKELWEKSASLIATQTFEAEDCLKIVWRFWGFWGPFSYRNLLIKKVYIDWISFYDMHEVFFFSVLTRKDIDPKILQFFYVESCHSL